MWGHLVVPHTYRAGAHLIEALPNDVHALAHFFHADKIAIVTIAVAAGRNVEGDLAGGWIEYVLRYGIDAVDNYLHEAQELGFDIVELSTGFISLPAEDLVRLVKRVLSAGLKAKPELGIQFGAGGATATAELAAEGTRDARWVIDRARRCVDAGAHMIMIESEGITENVETWRTNVVAEIVFALGIENTMFEAADPAVFGWYVKNHGPEINLFVDHSQIVQLECLRSGIWGTKSTWGRVMTYGAADGRH